MFKIKRWNIENSDTLSNTDKEFIVNLNPTIYWSDDRLCHWCFDTKLPSGRWLENIIVEELDSDDCVTFKAFVTKE